MSSFLGFESFLIPLGASILDTQNTWKTALTSRGWQVHYEDSANGILDVKPPSGETIGDGKVIEVTRLITTGTQVQIQSYQTCIATGKGQMEMLKQNVAGAVACSATINGVTVTGATGTAGSTAAQNLRALYEALRDSADGSITDWDYYWVPENGTLVDQSAYIIMQRKTVNATKITVTVNANVTKITALTANNYMGVQSAGQFQPFGFQSGHVTTAKTVTIDLINGFVYYMTIFSRTFLIGTKTNAGYSGPIFATYIDHATAMAGLPNSPWVTPIELLIGKMDESRGVSATVQAVRLTHVWRFGENGVSLSGAPSAMSADAGPYTGSHPWYGIAAPRVWMDRMTWSQYNSAYLDADAQSLCATTGNSTTDLFLDGVPVVPMGLPSGRSYDGSTNYGTYVFQGAQLPDIFRSTTSFTDEVLHLVEMDSIQTTLVGNLDATTAYTTLNLADASGLQTAGFVVINREIFQYTGKSGNQLTGVTRGKYGSKQVKHYNLDTVRQGAWFVKIKEAAMFAGWQKPS